MTLYFFHLKQRVIWSVIWFSWYLSVLVFGAFSGMNYRWGLRYHYIRDPNTCILYIFYTMMSVYTGVINLFFQIWITLNDKWGANYYFLSIFIVQPSICVNVSPMRYNRWNRLYRKTRPILYREDTVTKSCKSACVFPSILLKSQEVMGCQSEFLSNSFCLPLAQGIVPHPLLAPVVVVLRVLGGFYKISMVPYTKQNM